MSIKTDNTPMGYMYIGESFSPSGGVTNLNETKCNENVWYITFDTNLQDFDVENRNKRYYDASNIMECIKSEKIQSLLHTGGWFGEFDHPAPENVGEKLSPERIQNVPPKYRAFKIMDPHLVGNILKASIQSAQGEVGKSFRDEVVAGWQPQFSARAIATMVMKNGKPYVQVRKLITYDAPWYPSHSVAHATSSPKVTVKPISNFTESVTNVVESAKEAITDVTLPLTEILKEIGRTDVNTGLILEAFDLGPENLYGIDDSRTHAIIKDGNNMIYSNISPTTVKKVNDFFASF